VILVNGNLFIAGQIAEDLLKVSGGVVNDKGTDSENKAGEM